MTTKPYPFPWLPKNMRKTVGGQPVGLETLHCESFGGSDYCRHCGRDMCTATGKPNICCTLEEVKLRLIPDEAVSAFACEIEASCILDHPNDATRCDTWCHRENCTFSLVEIATDSGDGH